MPLPRLRSRQGKIIDQIPQIHGNLGVKECKASEIDGEDENSSVRGRGRESVWESPRI